MSASFNKESLSGNERIYISFPYFYIFLWSILFFYEYIDLYEDKTFVHSKTIERCHHRTF